LVMGVLFVLVVLFLPSGLAGLISQLLDKVWPASGYHRHETIDVKSDRPEEIA
jgi:hypothetical protein